MPIRTGPEIGEDPVLILLRSLPGRHRDRGMVRMERGMIPEADFVVMPVRRRGRLTACEQSGVSAESGAPG